MIKSKMRVNLSKGLVKVFLIASAITFISIPNANALSTVATLESGFTWAGSKSATLTPTTGWTVLSNVSRDDNFLNIALGFNVTFEGILYNTIQVHSNTYIGFSNLNSTSALNDTANPSQYNSITPGSPALPSIHMCSKDNSYQYVYYRFENANTQLRVRYEGNNTTIGTLGSPTIVYEALFTKDSSVIDIGMGISSTCDQNAGAGLLGVTAGTDATLEATWPTATYSSGYSLSSATNVKNKDYRISAGPMVSSFSSSQTTPTKTTSDISYSLTLSQSVTGLEAVDFANAGTATGCTFTPSSSSGSSFTITISGCGEGTLIPRLTANSVTGTSVGPSSNSSATTTITIDRTPPTISSVSATNGSYAPGNAINLVTVFNESVTVTGTPRIPITIGTTTRYANYVSMSDSRTATFRYTVAVDANDLDTDGIVVTSPLELNSGSIADLAVNAMTGFTFTPPVTTSVLVNQRAGAPTITSITPGNTQLSVVFTAGDTGGASITNYKYSLNGGAFTSSGSTTSPIVITSLTNGTSYAVRLLAVTSAGDGDSSTAVTSTPTAVLVGGGSNISRAYGSTSSSSAFTASGGTSPYSFSLSGASSGITVDASTGIVTASSTLAVGTYSPSVVATDSNGTPRTGSKSMTITISQATPTISISLPIGATDAALGTAITITATVSQGGSVNFRLGGSSISGCSSVSSSAGSATCSWTPASLGGVVLTAVLTPNDSTNYANATSTNLNITVVNGVTSVSLSLAGGVTTVAKGQVILITATVDQAGRISFTADGKRLTGCTNLSVSGSTKTCSWKPAIRKQVNLSARLVPTNSAYATTSASLSVLVIPRTGAR